MNRLVSFPQKIYTKTKDYYYDIVVLDEIPYKTNSKCIAMKSHEDLFHVLF